MPSDVTGSSIYNQRTADFEFRPGPIFTNLLLADEINRAPPKTQAALLEAMQERQVTIEGLTRRLERPFLVLATQNPIEHEGTYPLARGAARPVPAADLGRLPVPRGRARHPRAAARPPRRRGRARPGRGTARRCARCSGRSRTSTSPRAIGYYIVDVVRATRDAASVQVGASPRGTLAILKLSRARAALDGRDFVVPDDVKAVAGPALAHRLSLRPELWVQQVRAEDVVAERLETVPTPPAEER